MNLIFIVYVYASMLFVFITHRIDTAIVGRSHLKREIRFTKFDAKIHNKTVGTVVKCGIRMLRNKHMLFIETNVREKITAMDGHFSVSKCKQYYIDCVNVISYDINDICSKMDVVTLFMKIENQLKSTQKCPIYGGYSYDNMTVDADKFGPMFSFPLEKWWELYWKVDFRFIFPNKVELGIATLDFYYLEFRVKNHRK